MSELRRDPLTGRWVIIAAGRQARPSDFQRPRLEQPPEAKCPFCYGAEDMTPPEVYALRRDGSKPNTPGWDVRVVPNKYPALGPGLLRTEAGTPLQLGASAVGRHEVVIHNPHHDLSLGLLEEEAVTDVVRAYRDRFLALSEEECVTHVTAIINQGKEAGASLAHPHSQIFALPIVPEVVERELDSSRRYFEGEGACLLCSVIDDERASGVRVVAEVDGYIIYVPFASGNPFGLMLAPVNHLSNFEKLTDEDLPKIARALRKALQMVQKELGDPPYNAVLHSAPFVSSVGQYYHWHIEIVPRLSTYAGFEIGSGIHINSVAPESAAEAYRSFS